MRTYKIMIILVGLLTVSGTAVFGQMFGPTSNYPVGDFPRGICAADFDGDTYLDLAVANRGDTDPAGSDSISILFNNGDGTFGTAVTYYVGIQPSGITAADFDGDGHPDLAVSNWDSDNISVLDNDGSGNFGAAVNYDTGPAGASPLAIVAADFTGEGDPDIAVVNQLGNNAGILKNDGNGNFLAVVGYAAGTAPYSIVAADFDNDFAVDLATANNDDDNASVLVGGGNGTFAGPVNYAVGDRPRSVKTADFNGDGWMDLAVGNYGTHNVSVLLNNQDGTFAAAANYNAASNPRGITAVDLDGDALIDLAVANYTSNNVSILINNGGGTFPTHEEFPVGTNPTAICSGDFDKDGANDLAVVNFGSNNVSVLLNGEINTGVAADVDDDLLPERATLHQNYPNPFNPSTIIEFALVSRDYVNLGVYNINGQRIKQLADREFAAGNHAISWDGRDESGEPVATGVYFYRLRAGDIVESKKMVLLK